MPDTTAADDDGAHRPTARRLWAWWGGGLVVVILVLSLLSQVVPVTTAVVAGYGAMAVGMLPGRRKPEATAPVPWVLTTFSTLVFIGLGLLAGAVGLAPTDEHRDRATAGALLGAGALLASGVLLLVVVLRGRRHRRTAVSQSRRPNAVEPVPDGGSQD